jgi:hypothetical protein
MTDDDFTGCPMEVLSPVGLSIRHPRAAVGDRGILLYPKCKFKGLWTLAAELGFPQLSTKQLKQLGAARGIEFQSQASCVEMVAALCRKILHPLEDARLAEILEARFHQTAASITTAPHEASEVLEDMGNLEEVLEADDREEIESFQKTARSSREKDAELMKEVREWLAEDRGKKALRAAGNAVAGASPMGSSQPSRGGLPQKKRWTAPPVESDWTPAAAKALGPNVAGFTIGRTDSQGRWFTTYQGTTRSFSWGIWGGQSTCVRKCLQWAWSKHEEATGERCTDEHCPVEGIFDPRRAAP